MSSLFGEGSTRLYSSRINDPEEDDITVRSFPKSSVLFSGVEWRAENM